MAVPKIQIVNSSGKVLLSSWDCRECKTTNIGGNYCVYCLLNRDGEDYGPLSTV